MKKTHKLFPKSLIIIMSLTVAALIGVSVWYFSTTVPGGDTEIEHVFDEGVVIKEPTLFEEGILLRTCTGCGYQIEVALDKLTPAYVITIDGIGEYPVAENGIYKLEDPEKVGFEFVGWVDSLGNAFSKEGTVSQSVTIYPEFRLLETKTVEELAERAEKGAEMIFVVNDIVIDRPIFVTSTTKIYSDKPVKLIRAEGYLGDMFVIGQSSEGENSILMNLTPALILGNEDYTGDEILLTVDGNCDGMQQGAEVVGTALLLLNSARVDMYNGVSISNHKKLGNERILTISQYQVGTTETIGGAAVMIGSGSAFYMHGGIMDNNSARVETLVLDDETSVNRSGYGGAVYNNGTFRMYGGKITNCSANRGGAIYTDSVVEITGGILEGNYASNKGGALCSSGTAAADLFIGVKDAEIGTVIFRNNSSKNQGGAILSYFNSPLLLFGGVLFEGNAAIETNGGAIATSGPITSHGNSFIGNTAKSGGGAIYQTFASDRSLRTVELSDNIFEGNSANSGGAIYVTSLLDASDCSFSGNSAKSGGAVYLVRPAAFVSCEFTENTASYRGGALYVAYNEELKNVLKATVVDSRFVSNSATEGGENEERRGGAIYVGEYSIINITSTDFEGNCATQYGGAISGARASVIKITDSGIKESSATNGGAIWIYSDASLEISGSELLNNTASKDGGAIYSYNVVEVTTTTFKGNSASGGGAIAVLNGTATTQSCVFESNSATSGGAVRVSNGSFVDGKRGDADSGSTFTDNLAYRGGAIYVNNDDAQTGRDKLTVNYSVFKANKATEGGADELRRGGAIYLAEYVTATVNDSLFEENSATQYAGAIDVARGSRLYVNGSTFNKNIAGISGGAIWLYSGSSLTLASGNFEENTAGSNGGAIYSYNAADITSTSFINNSADNGGAIFIAGGSASVSDSTFNSNTAENYGGAVYVSENTVFSDGRGEGAGSEFKENTSTYGGAIYISSVEDIEETPDRVAGRVELEGSRFEKNTATADGGAIYAGAGTYLATANTSFAVNSAKEGGAIKLSSSSLAYIDNGSHFTGNTATENEGGAIYAQRSLELTNTVFEENKVVTSGKRGGAIYLNVGAITANGVRFEDNFAAGNGGAIVITAAESSTFTNCSFTNNESALRGGAIYSTGTDNNKTVECEFNGNKATERGGAIYVTTTGNYIDDGSEFVENVSFSGGAIFVDKGANLNGTVFENNMAVSTEEGVASEGGAIASEYGSVTLVGVSITGNTADVGGAIFDGKRLKIDIKGASITNNNSGIVISGGSISVSGRVLIKDNTAYDVSLADGKLIVVSGELDSASSIGFSLPAESGDFAKPDGEVMTDISEYAGVFFNTDGYPVFLGENGRIAYGLIISQQPTAENGYTVSTVWQPTAYAWYTWVNGERGEIVAGENTATLTNGIGDQSYICVLYFGDMTVETRPVTVKPPVVMQSHPICGSVCECDGAVHEDIEWYPIASLEELISAVENGGSYYLTEDIVIDATLNITVDVNICLNGKKLSRSGDEAFSMLSVASGATLTLTDCKNDERIGYIDPVSGLWTEGAYSGEGTAIEYKLYGGLITNGAGAGGRAIYVYGTLNTYRINFAGNSATSGGAVYVAGIYNDVGSTFVGNTVSNRGGAIYVAYDENVTNVLRLTVSGSTFIYNKAMEGGDTTTRRGGAIYVGEYMIVNINDSVFEGNSASQYGGAISVARGTALTLTDSTFKNNTSGTNGGAIWLYTAATLEVNECEFSGNSTGTNGGAIYSYNTLSITNTEFANNTAASGGALYCSGTLSATNTTFASNVASKYGGAIYASGDLTATNCDFTNNKATTEHGGAIYITGAVELRVIGGTMRGNETVASKGGGAIAVYANDDKECPTAYISGTVFEDNSAYSGGAIALYNTNAENKIEHTIENVTLINNEGGNGNIYIYNNTKVTVRGLVANNNTATQRGSVIYVTSSNAPTLILESAEVSGNVVKGAIDIIHIANKSAVVNVCMDQISGDDFVAAGITDTTDITADGWSTLINNASSGTVTGYTTPNAVGSGGSTEQ